MECVIHILCRAPEFIGHRACGDGVFRRLRACVSTLCFFFVCGGTAAPGPLGFVILKFPIFHLFKLSVRCSLRCDISARRFENSSLDQPFAFVGGTRSDNPFSLLVIALCFNLRMPDDKPPTTPRSPLQQRH